MTIKHVTKPVHLSAKINSDSLYYHRYCWFVFNWPLYVVMKVEAKSPK